MRHTRIESGAAVPVVVPVICTLSQNPNVHPLDRRCYTGTEMAGYAHAVCVEAADSISEID